MSADLLATSPTTVTHSPPPSKKRKVDTCALEKTEGNGISLKTAESNGNGASAMAQNGNGVSCLAQ